VLGANGRLYHTDKGQSLPHDVPPMPLLTEEELKTFPEPTTQSVVPNCVARYWDLMALADRQPAKVVGPDALLRDRPGFEIDFVRRDSIPETPYSTSRHEVLMVMRGHWRLAWEGGEATLAPGDTCAVPPNLAHALAPTMTGETSLYRVRNTDDPAGQTWKPN
jgi:mannose-6-phosphate isomerase-like protein (cupin superfamily)